MKKIGFLFIALSIFVFANGQNLDSPERLRIRNIEIRGKGVEIRCVLPDIHYEYDGDGEIIFIDDGKSLGNVNVDSTYANRIA
jgi:hypothetical protein